jgi:NYN domain
MLTEISVKGEPAIEQGVGPGVRLAVLIDAENVSVDLWPHILRLLRLLGEPVVMRAYTCAKPGRWQSISGIEVIDGGKDVTGPNAADFLLAFDAGRLVVSNDADQFVIVSGDDGFAPLIKALQLSGKATSIIVPTCGSIGDRKSVKVADVTMLIPQYRIAVEPNNASQPVSQAKAKASNGGIDDRKDRLTDSQKTAIRNTVEDLGRSPDGWVLLNEVGQDLSAKKAIKLPGKLSTLLASLDFIEIRDLKTPRCSVRVRQNRLIDL